MKVFYGLAITLVILALTLDAARGFLMVPPREYLLFLVLTLLLAWFLERRRRPGAGLYRTLLRLGLLLAFLQAATGLTIVILQARIHGSWAEGASARLQEPALRIRKEFGHFLSDLERKPPSWANGVPDPDRLRRFRRLEELSEAHRGSSNRYGWTLWRGGAPDAWAGRTTSARAFVEAAGGPRVRVVQRGAAFILTAREYLSGQYVLQSEYLVQSPLDRQPILPLPSLQEARREERVGIQLLVEPVSGAPLSPGGDLGRIRLETPPGSPARVSFFLQGPSGQPLAALHIQDRREEAIQEKLVHRGQAAALALCFLFLVTGASLAYRRSGTSRFPTACLLVSLALAAAARLLPLIFHAVFHGVGIFDPDRFASGIAWEFLKSPADLFLTALLLFLGASGWSRWVLSRNLSPRVRRTLAWAHLPVVLALAGFVLQLAWQAPRDARFEILKVEFSPPDWGKLLVQGGLFLFSASLVTLVLAAVRLVPIPRAARPPVASRLPAAARLYALVAAAALLYLPVVALSGTRQRERFFSDKLVRRVERHQKERRDALKSVLRTLHGSRQVEEVIDRFGSGSGEGLAYEIWATTRLDEIGLSSSLRVFSSDGALLGRFGINLPSKWEARSPPGGNEASIRVLLTPGPGPRKRILVGETSRALATGEKLRFQVHLLDDYQNLPFVRADNLYVQLFPAPRTQETNPELLGSEPLVAVYDPKGRSLYCSLEGGLDLPRDSLVLAPGQSLWSTLTSQENSYQVLVKRMEDRLIAVGFLLPSGLERIGAFVRTTLLGTLLAGAVSLFLALLAGPVSRSGRRQGPFFRRLVALILLASLVPVLLLSFFLHRFLLREINEDISAEGFASLAAARRIVTDYLTARPGPEEARVDDDVAFWLSQVVRQDINFYSGDRLSATSAREIYTSGLLSTRLDPEVYKRLILLQEAYALSEARLGALRFQTISAPIVPGDRLQGILSLPLAEKRQEILRKRADVEEAILIVTVGMLLLLTALAHFLARRVSEPVVALSAAARRIEAGDYDAEVRVAARDEPALLIESFNRMAASLRRQREDLRRRSDYIEKILLNATTGVISTNSGGNLVTINPAARLLLGLPASGALEGEPFSTLLARSDELAPLRESLEGSDAERERTWQITIPGDRVPLSLRVVSLPFRETPQSPAGRILLLEDLTEAVRSSRLEAWAEMARRIAHEIKNPLTPIQLSVDHLRRTRRSRDPRFEDILEECLSTIQKQVQTLRGIAREFSDYARIPQVRPERVPPGEILRDVVGPLQAAPPEGIQIVTSIEPGTPDLLVDRELVRRALTNLVQNSLEAMSGGGRLSVRMGAEPGGGRGRPPRVRIVVSDSGAGMDAATLSRLFEPYFSTKETGTGLGLSIVRKTVEEQGGEVSVASSPGTGTQVSLLLPSAGPGEPAETPTV